MKKNISYIIIVLLLVLLIASGTYAYYIASVRTNDVITNSNTFEVIYTGGQKISGKLEFANSKNENMKTTVNIMMAQDSVMGIADLYIKIEEITDNIANEALSWEVKFRFQ